MGDKLLCHLLNYQGGMPWWVSHASKSLQSGIFLPLSIKNTIECGLIRLDGAPDSTAGMRREVGT